MLRHSFTPHRALSFAFALFLGCSGTTGQPEAAQNGAAGGAGTASCVVGGGSGGSTSTPLTVAGGPAGGTAAGATATAGSAGNAPITAGGVSGAGGAGTETGGTGDGFAQPPGPLPTTWIPVDGYSSNNPNIAHGAIRETTYDNSVLGKVGANGRKANVYTPPGYDSAKKYPVLYALHGIGGDHKEWLSSKPQEILDDLYAAGKIAAMVVVFPNGRAMNPDTPPSDIYGASNTTAFDDFWSKDFRDFLIPHIEKTFAVYADKQHRALLGYSMGGMQALQFGLGNPDDFAWVGALAPATAGLGHPDVGKMDPAAMNASFSRIFVSAGTKDSLGLFAPAQAFHEALSAKGIVNVWVAVENGNHDGTTWSPGLYNFSQIIFR